jgi:hypothetical protein
MTGPTKTDLDLATEILSLASIRPDGTPHASHSYISLLDYTKGFGHTEHFQIGATAANSQVQKFAAGFQ